MHIMKFIKHQSAGPLNPHAWQPALPLAALLLAAGSAHAAPTIPGNNSYHYHEIVMPSGMNSVVKAVNVADTAASTVNGITFEADTGPWTAKLAEAHNGYPTDCGPEGSSGCRKCSLRRGLKPCNLPPCRPLFATNGDASRSITTRR
ncbi:MAG: hypothetical protein NTW21_41670 [Verrucomicrobia bacterium]|nr:hypothetical protein [Verrucomicrobiota bacterium]